MDWLRSLVEQMQTFWAGLSPGVQDGLEVAVIVGIMAWLWGKGGSIFKLLLGKNDKTPPVATKEEADGQRDALLDGVETAWIQGVLEKSLYQEVLIALDVDDRSGMVAPPVKITIQTPAGPPQELPSTQNILQIFDKSGGRLLILGEPGSGKTITLLTLARQLIQRARNDPHYPLPVVFNLASWTEKQQLLDAWLIAELETKYRVPKSLGRYWVETRELLLLLDGLDEVREDLRSQCIQAINDYADARVKMAVCSRRQEYEGVAAEIKLAMHQAIWLQPLSTTQIFAYLRQLGARAASVEKVLKEDKDLLELAQTPLLLNVMLLAYQDGDDQAVAATASLQEKRGQLFDHYIRRVLLHHGNQKHPWAPAQVLRWLRWIARGLLAHSEAEFLLERLQSDWLTPNQQNKYYSSVVLVIPFLLSVAYTLNIKALHKLTSISTVILFGIIFFLGSFSLRYRKSFDIQPISSIKYQGFSHRSVIVFIASTMWALALSVLFGLFFGITNGINDGIVVTISISIISMPTIVYIYRLKPIKKINITTQPNTIIWQSGKNWVRVGIGIGALLGAVSGIITNDLYFGLLTGIMIGLLFALNRFGGRAFLLHWTLRFALWRYNHTPAPWRYVAFLDYAVQRILLRRVGGGWIFIHRMIMEHIAQLDDALIDDLDRELVCHLKRQKRLSDKEIRRITPFSQKKITRLGQACDG